MFDAITDGIRKWLIGLFASAINRTARLEDRTAAVQWLFQSRDIVASNTGSVEKFKKLNALINSRAAIVAIARTVGDGVANYRNSSLSWPMKIALPATLAALPFVGGHGAGIAAFGSAIGVPVLLLIFLGSAGITSIIEMVVTRPETRAPIAEIVERIIRESEQLRADRELKAAMRAEPKEPARFWTPDEDHARREYLRTMDPYEFEAHIMQFFKDGGLFAWVTSKSNDMGADGFAQHPEGLIAVQCKRNSPENKVGSPTIRDFWGSLEQHKCFSGYVVTTSTFTTEAIECAKLSKKIILIDIERLIEWHKGTPNFN